MRQAMKSKPFTICTFVALWAIPGCQRDADLSRFNPPSTAARDAVEKTLNAWQQGGASDSDTAPEVRLVDAARQAGEKLARYEIISQSGENPVRFSVRLQLENPSRDMEANYVVVGDNPIWVFREEEYTRQQGM